MKKKGQGISITVIIIAAIALVVLVVLIVMFVGRIGIFGERVERVTTDCSGTCFKNSGGYGVYGQVISGTSCGAGMHQSYGAYDDVSPGQLCCIDDTITSDECE